MCVFMCVVACMQVSVCMCMLTSCKGQEWERECVVFVCARACVCLLMHERVCICVWLHECVCMYMCMLRSYKGQVWERESVVHAYFSVTGFMCCFCCWIRYVVAYGRKESGRDM